MSFVCIYISKDLNYPVALEIEQRTRRSYVADLWQSDESSTPHDNKSQPSVVWWNGAPRKGLRLINSYYFFHWFWDSYLYRLSLKSQTARTMVIALLYYSPFRLLPFRSHFTAYCNLQYIHIALYMLQICQVVLAGMQTHYGQLARPRRLPEFPSAARSQTFLQVDWLRQTAKLYHYFFHIFTDLPFKHLDQLQIEDILYHSAQGHLAVRSKFHIKTAPAQLPSYFPSWFSALATWQTLTNGFLQEWICYVIAAKFKT